MSSLLVRLFGFHATLHHGDALVWDRWRWLRRRLRLTRNGEMLLDVGCGSGAFTIGAALAGFDAIGLSWDERNQAVAQERARLCSAGLAKFEICDVRELGEREEYKNRFDRVICTENIEHILDDRKLIVDIAACMMPGARLFLTTPWIDAIGQSSQEFGPFPDFEDGRHVRRGYSRQMLLELFELAGLRVEDISFVSGPISQLNAFLLHQIGKRTHPVLGWLFVLPLRPLPPLFDRLLMRIFRFPPFSIAVEASKARFPDDGRC